MKILVVSQYYAPDITAAAFRITETVGHLKELGHDVVVITTFPHKSKHAQTHHVEDGISRVHLPGTENKGFLGYIYLYLSFLIKSIVAGFSAGRKQKPDVIWATSPPIFVGLSGWVLSKLLRTGFALDIRDIWPDSAVAAGQLSESGFGYKIGRVIEKFLYKRADLITCVANPMRDYIRSFTVKQTEVIYNGVEIPENGQTKETEDVLEPLALAKDSKKMLYAGNFGHVQQLDLLISVLSELKNSPLKHHWEIFLLGGGAKQEKLRQQVQQLGLSAKVHFLDPVPKQEVFAYLKSADALFIHLMDSEVLRLTIPSKVFDYMLADRPLLAGIHGEGREIIEEETGNVTFSSGDKTSLKEAFLQLDNLLTGKSLSLQNGQTVRDSFSRKSQSIKLHNLFNQTFLSK